MRVDWARAPEGTTQVPITVTGPGASVVVQAVVDNPALPRTQLRGFVEANGYVSIEADSLHPGRERARGRLEARSRASGGPATA